MKFFVFLLIVSLINLSVTNGQETCRQWREDKSTDLLDALGHWFTYLEDKYLVKKNDLCSEYTFTWNTSTHSMNLLNTVRKEDNSIETITGSAHKTQYPGVLNVEYDNGLIFQGRAVTMSEHFILFAGCFNQKDYIRIVTRDRVPTEEVRDIIEAEITDLGIDRSKMIYACQ